MFKKLVMCPNEVIIPTKEVNEPFRPYDTDVTVYYVLLNTGRNIYMFVFSAICWYRDFACILILIIIFGFNLSVGNLLGLFAIMRLRKFLFYGL